MLKSAVTCLRTEMSKLEKQEQTEKKADFAGRNAELDITAFLVGSDNMIPRGSWLSLEVRPDDLAYISIDLIVQGFIQSRGDNTV